MKRFKYFFRKFRYNRKRSTLVGVLVLLCLFLTLGFAYLTTELNINGIANISSSRWDVHFENIEINDGSVEATTEPTISNDTTISFSATLNSPGEYYQFTTDIVNDGTYDAKIDSITLSPTLTSEEEEFFEYNIEYTEGGNIQVDDALDAGTSENITVLFKYKTNADSSVYPEEDKDFTVEVTITYVQGKGNKANHTTLYSVLKDAASDGTYAREYTGEHQDSMAGVGNKKIYHWYAPRTTAGNSLATEILDKNNVIFAGKCWQMFRTTDTGGVKMIYNGVPNDGKCNNTGTAQQIGKSAFNLAGSLADVGYMYNTRYTYNSDTVSDSASVLVSGSMTGSTNYYYGTGVTYDTVTGKYTLTGISQATWSSTYSSSSGLYTCQSATETTCSNVYYIVGGDSSHLYGFLMANGNLLNYYNTNIVLGTGYTESNNIYTLSNTVTISKADWYSNYSTYKNYYTCWDSSTSCSNLRYIFITTSTFYRYIFPSNNSLYANSFTYNESTGKYTLSNDRAELWNLTTNESKTALSTHHYTCFNMEGECSTLSYVYHVFTSNNSSLVSPTIYYINLENGKSINDALNEMLYSDDVNTTNSTIKTYIDNWYHNNMTDYTDYLEDTIFCNDRSISNSSNNGWNPNGGSIDTSVRFITNSTLLCANITDKYCMGNNKAHLTYPVGLLNYAEVKLLENDNLWVTGESYWVFYISDYDKRNALVHFVSSSIEGVSILHAYYTNSSYGVRPVVSLKRGINYSSGDGSKNNPYVIDTNSYVFDGEFSSYQDAMAASGQSVFSLEVKDAGGNVIDSYIGFVLNDEPYYLHGGIDEHLLQDKPVYDSNKQILQEAFGSSNCSESVNNGYADYYCSIPDMSAGVNSGGSVLAGEGDYFCNLYDGGSLSCGRIA